MKRILFICTLFLGIGLTTGFTQTDKMKKKATELVVKLNDEIVAVNRGQKLTKEQEEQVYNIHLERLQELKKANKNAAGKEAKKAINQKYYKRIYKDVLNKYQKNARKVSRGQKKANT